MNPSGSPPQCSLRRGSPFPGFQQVLSGVPGDPLRARGAWAPRRPRRPWGRGDVWAESLANDPAPPPGSPGLRLVPGRRGGCTSCFSWAALGRLWLLEVYFVSMESCVRERAQDWEPDAPRGASGYHWLDLWSFVVRSLYEPHRFSCRVPSEEVALGPYHLWCRPKIRLDFKLHQNLDFFLVSPTFSCSSLLLVPCGHKHFREHLTCLKCDLKRVAACTRSCFSCSDTASVLKTWPCF